MIRDPPERMIDLPHRYSGDSDRRHGYPLRSWIRLEVVLRWAKQWAEGLVGIDHGQGLIAHPVNSVIGQIGAATNRLEFASTNLSSIIQNTMAAESTIRDADMAYEMMQFSKQNILAQAGTAMLAQANSLSQSVLQLLR